MTLSHNCRVVIDITAFRTFERAGWNERAGAYERFFTAVSEHNVVPLLDAAHVEAGRTVLDAGCGPGNLAPPPASGGAFLVGTDLSAALGMIARERHPQIEL